ncbi:MAG: hypothetical protein ACT6T3_21335 [Agrobacterium sp.]|uniref:hypothetical protein n=1 Tax=Agrobacterium sp. TaxID=361 RepID=UPI00403367E2
MACRIWGRAQRLRGLRATWLAMARGRWVSCPWRLRGRVGAQEGSGSQRLPRAWWRRESVRARMRVRVRPRGVLVARGQRRREMERRKVKRGKRRTRRRRRTRGWLRCASRPSVPLRQNGILPLKPLVKVCGVRLGCGRAGGRGVQQEGGRDRAKEKGAGASGEVESRCFVRIGWHWACWTRLNLEHPGHGRPG